MPAYFLTNHHFFGDIYCSAKMWIAKANKRKYK